MDRNTRWFILAALFYLAVGGVLGLLMEVVPDSMYNLHFAHVHIMLGGFMAMMIYGVGYFILPRFASSGIRWPALVGVHLWLGNISLILLVISYQLSIEALASSAWSGVAHLAATGQLISLFMFTGNLGMTLIGAARPPQQAETPQAAAVPAPAPTSTPPASAAGSALPMAGQGGVVSAPLGPDSTIAEFIDRKAGVMDVIIEAGLKPLSDPQHLQMVKERGLTLSFACSRHDIDFDALLERIKTLPDLGDTPGAGAPVSLGPGTVIGDLVRQHPMAKEVLRKRFGEGCFTCPGFNTETLSQGAMMHGVELGDLIAEIEAAIK